MIEIKHTEVLSSYSHIARVADAGTDFAAFVQYIGVPSLDISYGLCMCAHYFIG